MGRRLDNACAQPSPSRLCTPHSVYACCKIELRSCQSQFVAEPSHLEVLWNPVPCNLHIHNVILYSNASRGAAAARISMRGALSSLTGPFLSWRPSLVARPACRTTSIQPLPHKYSNKASALMDGPNTRLHFPAYVEDHYAMAMCCRMLFAGHEVRVLRT